MTTGDEQQRAEPKRGTRVTLFLRYGAFTLLLLALIGVVIVTSHPRVRYMEDKCAYRCVYTEDGAIDAAFFGSSHAVRAVGAVELTDAMEPLLGRRPVVYDLSRSQRGMGHNFVMIRDLLDERDVRLMVVEYNQRHSGVQPHSLWYVKAKYGDFVRHIGAEPDIPLAARGARVLRWVADRVTYRVQEYKRTRRALFEPHERAAAATCDCSRGENQIEQDELEEVAVSVRDVWRTPVDPSWGFDDPDEHLNSYFIEHIVRLCETRGAEPVFVFYPRFMKAPLSDAFVAAFEARFDVPLLHPPVEVLEEVYGKVGYADATHMTPFGRTVLMNWLATELAPRLGERVTNLEGTLPHGDGVASTG